jgi:low affinity Fe/Cu permease
LRVVEPVKIHWTTYIGQAAGHPAAFVIVIVYAALWLIVKSWNAVATLAVFMMTLFIQRTNRRDNLALHAKLDELLRVDDDARSELTQLDEQEPEAIEQRHRHIDTTEGRGMSVPPRDQTRSCGAFSEPLAGHSMKAIRDCIG